MQNQIIEFDQYFKQYLNRGITGGLPWKHWNYKDDIMVLGAYYLFCATKDDFYRDVILKITQGKLLPDEAVCGKNLDEVSSAKTDMVLYKLTGEKRFQERMQKKLAALKDHPRTKSGNFWHKDLYPNQVWLDGLYMALPIYLQDAENANDAMAQIEKVREIMYNPQTGLYVHAWDEAKVQEWADSKTGNSKNVWSRAMGWLLMAFVDCYPLMPKQTQKDRLAQLLQEAVAGLMPYESESKMFYQLVNLPKEPGNYLETSGSAMVAYALMKGSRLGMLDSESFALGAEILEAIASLKLRKQNYVYMLDGICGSAGLGAGPDNRTDRDGTVKYYLSEAIRPDNQHGAAACMMAYSEYIYGGK